MHKKTRLSMPIIKSKGRKDRDYSQLVNYMFHHDDEQEHSFTHFHNIYGIKENDRGSIIQKLENNVFHKSYRKGGVGMFHEMVSFAPQDSEYLKEHPEILEDIVEQYMELRVGNSMGIAKPHFDKDHVHIHFCFTPNEKDNGKSIRLTKAQFQKVRRDLENYQLENYPELTHSYVHMRDNGKSTAKSLNQNEWGMDQRKVKRSKKEELSAKVSKSIQSSSSLEEISSALIDSGYQPYYRKNVLQGVIIGKRKYRLSTLTKNDLKLNEFVLSLQKQGRGRNNDRNFGL